MTDAEMKEFVGNLSDDDFERLIAHYCIKVAHNSIVENQDPAGYEDYLDFANSVFYEGMNDDPGVADHIEKLFDSPLYNEYFTDEEEE